MSDGAPFEHWASADDGHQIYVQSVGEGPAIVCANGIGCSTGFWRYIRRYFQPRHQVVTWDYRGHGKTPPPRDLTTLTVPQLARDMCAVLDELAIDRAVFVGHSMGSQLILEFYRQFPERTAGLVPLLGTYGRPTHTFFDSPIFGQLFPILQPVSLGLTKQINTVNRIVTGTPLAFQFAKAAGIVSQLCKMEDMEDYFDHLSKLDMKIFLTLARDMADHTTEDILAQIDVPVLVIGGERDLFTPVWLSQEMHELIPDSELLIVPGGSHAALVEQPELINLRVEKFMRERVADRRVHESEEAAVLGEIGTTRSKKHG